MIDLVAGSFGQRAEPGVNFSTDSNSINVRGLDENNVLTTIDGIRLPWLGSGDPRGVTGGLSTFDFNALTTIDIVRAADSSIVGSGGHGRPRRPDDALGRRHHRRGPQVGLPDEEHLFERQPVLHHLGCRRRARFGDTSVLVQGSWTTGHQTETNGDEGGYGTTRTEANPMDFDQYSLLGKLTQDVDGGHRFTLTGELFNL